MNIDTSIEPLIDSSMPTSAVTPTRELFLHPQMMRVWMLGALAVLVPAVLVCAVVALLAQHLWILLIGLVVTTTVFLAVLAHARAWLARFRCRLLADGLWVDQGVWWRSETFVPRARIQHTEVQQGPIARRYGIANLKVFTAGASHGQIDISGLTHEDALWLRDELLGRHGHDGV